MIVAAVACTGTKLPACLSEWKKSTPFAMLSAELIDRRSFELLPFEDIVNAGPGGKLAERLRDALDERRLESRSRPERNEELLRLMDPRVPDDAEEIVERRLGWLLDEDARAVIATIARDRGAPYVDAAAGCVIVDEGPTASGGHRIRVDAAVIETADVEQHAAVA